MCKEFPNRHGELDAYLAHISDLSSTYQAMLIGVITMHFLSGLQVYERNVLNFHGQRLTQRYCTQLYLLSNIIFVTTVKVICIQLRFAHLSTHPDQVFASTLVRNLKEGFRVGYAGPEFSSESPNLISAYEHPDNLSACLAKEIEPGHNSGPPFSKFFV